MVRRNGATRLTPDSPGLRASSPVADSGGEVAGSHYERRRAGQLERREGQGGDPGLREPGNDRRARTSSPVADRIATFDNDGTLWVEQPLPPQFDFVFGKWAEEVNVDPSLATKQPYKAIIEKDPAFFVGLATQDPEIVGTLLKGFARSWAGTTPDEFEAQVRVWLDTVKQPKLGQLYVDLVYKPMLELFDLLKAHDFRSSWVSGGGREFMRVFAEDAFGIYKENVIGTAAEYNFS